MIFLELLINNLFKVLVFLLIGGAFLGTAYVFYAAAQCPK